MNDCVYVRGNIRPRYRISHIQSVLIIMKKYQINYNEEILDHVPGFIWPWDSN